MKWIHDFVAGFRALTVEMSPWLLLGFFMAGLIHLFLKPGHVRRHLGYGGWRGALNATLIGIPLPLCSCGVLPVAMALRNFGASRSATLSFLSATPQTGVDSFLATWGILGLPVALIRVIAALLSGVLTGVLTTFLADNAQAAKKPDSPCCGEAVSEPEASGSDKPPAPSPSIVDAIVYGFWTLPKDMSRSLILGLGIGALLGMMGQVDIFKQWIHMPGAGYVVAILLALPLYVCSTGSIPLASGLMALGASPGAAMVFLILGPATNTITITSIVSMFGKRVTLMYVLVMSGLAIATGIILDQLPIQIISPGESWLQHHHHHPWWKTSAAIVLLSLILLPVLPYRWLRRKPDARTSLKNPCCGHEKSSTPDPIAAQQRKSCCGGDGKSSQSH